MSFEIGPGWTVPITVRLSCAALGLYISTVEDTCVSLVSPGVSFFLVWLTPSCLLLDFNCVLSFILYLN